MNETFVKSRILRRKTWVYLILAANISYSMAAGVCAKTINSKIKICTCRPQVIIPPSPLSRCGGDVPDLGKWPHLLRRSLIRFFISNENIFSPTQPLDETVPFSIPFGRNWILNCEKNIPVSASSVRHFGRHFLLNSSASKPTSSDLTPTLSVSLQQEMKGWYYIQHTWSWDVLLSHNIHTFNKTPDLILVSNILNNGTIYTNHW